MSDDTIEDPLAGMTQSQMANIYLALTIAPYHINPWFVEALDKSIPYGYLLSQLVFLERNEGFKPFCRNDAYFIERYCFTEWNLRDGRKRMKELGLIDFKRAGSPPTNVYTLYHDAISRRCAKVISQSKLAELLRKSIGDQYPNIRNGSELSQSDNRLPRESRHPLVAIHQTGETEPYPPLASREFLGIDPLLPVNFSASMPRILKTAPYINDLENDILTKQDQDQDQQARDGRASLSPQQPVISYPDQNLPATITHRTRTVSGEVDPYSADFGLWWDLYPLKKAKSIAAIAFKKATLGIRSGYPLDTLLEALKSQIEERRLLDENNEFVPEWPHPTTWLNQKRWEDVVRSPDEIRASKPKGKKTYQEKQQDAGKMRDEFQKQLWANVEAKRNKDVK